MPNDLIDAMEWWAEQILDRSVLHCVVTTSI